MIECAEPNWVTIGFENGMSIRVWVVCVVKASALMPGDKWAIGLQAQGARMHEWICAGADIDSEAMIKIEHTRATATGFVCWNSLIDVSWMQVYSPLLPAAHSRTPHALRGRFGFLLQRNCNDSKIICHFEYVSLSLLSRLQYFDWMLQFEPNDHKIRYTPINQRDIVRYLPIVHCARSKHSRTLARATTSTTDSTRSRLPVSHKKKEKKFNIFNMFSRMLVALPLIAHVSCARCEFDFNLHVNTNKLLHANDLFWLQLLC